MTCVIDREARTTADGKTSSVHWLRFVFTPAQIATFKGGREAVIVGMTHPNYGHMAVMSAAMRAALAKDFASHQLVMAHTAVGRKYVKQRP